MRIKISSLDVSRYSLIQILPRLKLLTKNDSNSYADGNQRFLNITHPVVSVNSTARTLYCFFTDQQLTNDCLIFHVQSVQIASNQSAVNSSSSSAWLLNARSYSSDQLAWMVRLVVRCFVITKHTAVLINFSYIHCVN